MRDFARALTEALAGEVFRHRALVRALERIALVTVVHGDGGAYTLHTGLVEDSVRILEGDVVPAHVPRVVLHVQEAGMRALFAGRISASKLATEHLVRMEGPETLTAAVAACFSGSANPLSIRFK